MATTNTNSSSNTTTTGGGVNLSPELAGGILGDILDNYQNQSGGVSTMTPELQAAINAMMNSNNGGNLVNQGSGFLDQAGNLLGGNTAITGDQVNNLAGQLVNQESIDNQLNQLQQQSQKGLTQSLSNIETGASMSGGLGSSRTALAQGEAISGANEALSNASANVISAAQQNALNQAMGILQGNQSSSLAQGNALANLGTGVAGMGQNMNQQQLQNLIQAGVITQQQADAMANKDNTNINNLLGQLGALMGTSQESNTNTTTSGSTDNSSDILSGILASAAGSGLDWLLGDKK